uniref:Lipocalin/cytosolic fatty-acid binding domain-containing protein n=1 Tax=Heliothis virescens TaxID=7102 RepID=A0A2A4JVA8_HELVI
MPSAFNVLETNRGQIVQLGQCDADVPIQEDFDIESFLGTWHEISRLDNPNQPGDCSSYELGNANNVLNIRHSSVNRNFHEEATGTISQDGNTARLRLSISSFENPIDFWVRSTDYTTFAITFSCENISNLQRRIHIWVLGREKVFSEMALALIYTTISTTFNIQASEFRTIDHSDDACYILPVIEPGEPIILPGQCDQTLPVLQNFNVDRFLGLWHQVSSYETPNSNGACVRSEFSRSNEGVNILNSEVLNQQLLTQDGHATVSSTDNSAKLSVVLNIPGATPTPQDLWILASDYDNYAVAYTCINTSPTNKQVYSWILSRTRVLPQSAQTAVDQVVDSYIDLNYQYYKKTDQSDAGCFFYPEPMANQPVVFRGQCESVNVQAMQNFEIGRYMGLWHNIELYPTAFQSGTCSNADYDLVGGSVTVVNSEVINERLYTVNAVAVPATSDGSAKLVVTFPIPGSDQTVSSDYWVLDTDYDNYAFVYSCSNLNADEMQVSSWKLSRTKTLSTASATAISNVMSTVSVLDQRYYETMDQSVQGCFYFPEPQAGVPVVFPGQCDENVAVLQDFDLQRLQGEWHEIQSYPKAQQPGQCINHQYTPLDNLQLNLESSSVTDQFLGVINGVVSRSSATDTTGRLTATITVNGEAKTIPFWILNTDYTDYAFAYSCVNLNSDFRGVWSWKLSRSKQLSAAANTAIANIVANNIVLQENYFETIDQSDEACFYLPELERGEAVILPGQCDTTIRGVPNFDISRYAGRWRLIESYGSDFQVGTCNVARYTLENPTTLRVINSQVVNAELAEISGTATIISNDGRGELNFYFPSRDENFEFKILDTDYESYALGYGCVNLNNNQRRVYSWKMSRENTLSQNAIDNMDRIINSINVLNNRFYYYVDRTDTGCFYFPTPDPSSNVRFRGRCENIPVVTGFDTQRYLGTWYDIESYPADFQDGTCNTATYSSGNDVTVLNTHVINQVLVSIRGNAVLEASTDQSAKLKVTFNVGGADVTSEYWVLDTDYDSYSLVYSCQTIDDEYVQVTSWKLSRTRTLQPAAATAINNVMSNIRVLDQRYFITRDHSAQGCFYYPEPQPGVSVVFPGQCDDSIAAVPDFDMSRFQGTWYEIEAYPKDNQPGQCINHLYTSSGTNTLTLESSNVFDLFLSTTSSNVRYDTTDGSGRLIISMPLSHGPVIDISYWILSTDYTDYALAYSCANIDSNYREVYSVKLSRTKQLTQEARTAISNAMENIDVIDERYFESIDQSDAACFHLPDIAPGQDVVLPGQCDENIRGIPNFDLTQFAGEWRLIESYGSRYQSGTCNVGEYKVLSDTVLEVTNSQVVNAALGPRTYDLYVLDTDYKSYALYYGCTNSGSNQRRVTSWKFSRTNTLSQEANDKINQIIDSIDVLHQPYYYTVDRTPEGCFYFPVPDRNTPVKFRGQCDESIPVVNNFDVSRYQGLWHDIQSYPVLFQDGDCPNAFYAPYDSSSVTVTNTHVVNQQLDVITGLATAPADGSAKLKVTFNVQNNQFTSNYWVLDTDYDSYALVYSCTNLDEDYMTVSSWKLSRTKSLSTAAAAAINNVMSNIQVLDQRYYIDRDQTPEGCFYYPEPQPGQAVVFPGQCDDSIAAVPDFDMNRFQGTWYEIEAYPKDNQPGQCINHLYTSSGTNTLNLESSNVFDLFLSTTSSNVRYDTTDGSGRLIISMPLSHGPVIDISYWILSTDYTDYALAYSCANIDSNYREVYSVKLSRTKQLTQEARTAISNAMESIDVIDERYFENIDQSDAACFHLPDIAPGQNIVLPGQCDENIRGIPNFDLRQFAGEWRLIESYGSRYQSGTCNVGEYKVLSDNVLEVTNSQVVNAALGSISGTATVTSTDGSGKLTFGYTNRPRTYDLYVLDTDYKSYALYYGCTNSGSNQRRVTSWKFSRTNTLSQEANDKINQIIDSIDVLHQPYYYTVDRTPEGCFYFPVPDRNTPVKFRGQCDENIPVVNNFDVSRYQGLWHDIQSYPVLFQDGDCPNAFYAPYDSSSVTVTNTHVVNQQLDVITGLATAPADGSAKLKVTFNVQNNQFTSDYWVLDTDYDSYAFVYSCTNLDEDYMTVSSWKLSRTKSLSTAAAAAINNVMSNIQVLDQRYYIDRDQTPEGCFYYPEPKPGQAVVFPGQCDDNIAAVPNFDLNAFQGTWHEITSYPKDNQPGECIREEFTLTSPTSMHLNSFSVINQRLYTAEGTVTYATDDGSGKLQINLINMGPPVPVPYWILSTDYIDYALVYSCRNINSDYREIWSWKLSRSRQLSNAGSQAIDNAMSAVDVLRNEYFEDIPQTDTACFYYPVLGPTDPVIFPGQCDANIPVIQDFDIDRYTGRWRLIESYYSDFQEGTCNAATYTTNNDGTVAVYNTKVVEEQLNSITGSAVLASDGSGKLTVTFPNGASPVEYWILGTDYISYALVYSCVNLPNDLRRVWTWKLSRTSSLTAVATNSINQIMNSVDVLDAQYYQAVDQTDTGCFYFPEPDRDTTVVFPGQCDENIPVVSDFDAARYAGTWYDIESYPTSFQSGTCNTATYTANTDGTIIVENTQVVNQVLQTTTGTATPTTSDNSAKFDVTFSLSSGPAEGTVTYATDDGSGKLQINLINMGPPVPVPYWILSTDYIDYALVYSCRNINSDYREIWSWKLSRSRQLSNAGSQAIDNAMSAVDVLRNEYFEDIPQTDTACFYYPVLGPTDPVIFPGQCDANIPVIQDFDIDRYTGRWRLIESYYSDFQEGTCNAATYTTNNDGTVAVYNTKVVEEQLNSITGSAVLASDGSGKLTVTFPNGASPVEYWILGTDYISYALVYSCVNLPNDLRRVWTWKLSRTSSLTAVATNSINQIMNSVDVLDAQYYQAVDQTDTGCFYFPEPDRDTTVVFPGQCDENIPVVSDFDAARYAGTWYDIESYPTSFQSGTCNTATYTANTDGTIIVENTQVVNQVLQTTTGTATPTTSDNSAKFDVTFSLSSGPATTKYWVLATDYDSYSLVYSCRNIDSESRAVYSWKLSRTQSLPAAAAPVINDVINSVQVLEQRYYVPRSHTEESCFFYPDNNGGDVILEGQCLPDAEIPAVTSFNPAAFAGTWHEVARFPSALQNGECTATQYLVNGNNDFNVMHTSVIEEALLSTNEVAEVDPLGRGVIRIDNSEVPFNNIYILATDYAEYALAYSCRNIEADRKQIYSWKLSRSRAGLSEQANSVVDELVSQNIDLFEGYYRYTKQDNAACFHYPVHDELPDSIILPGPCDESIRGVPNFNSNSYLGTWYEIARYPITTQQGQCNRGVYTSLNDIIYIENSQVINEHLTTISGQATVGQDGFGDLQVTFNVDDPRTAQYSVLATDYSSYALLYSCMNLDDGNRQVRSWKLSRTTSLTAQANNAIASVIADTEGLHEMYYQDTSQTDASCFHYPEFDDLPETIVLPGPCDDSITGVPNFSIANYLGEWIEIARYPQTAQTGQCNRAIYSSLGDNSVSIENTQVANEALYTISGQGVFASQDGSGVLQVTFNVGGVSRTSNYHVLATDYTSYSLVYTCTNLPSGNRQVGSWKLSRTDILSQNALDVIDDVINNTEGLNQTYYLDTSQTDDSCFYYPDPVSDGLSQSIILPGNCDTSIRGVDSFNITAFARTWYHIHRYDSVQGRSCSGTRLSLNEQTNNLAVTDFEVIDGELETTEYTGRVSSTDGSGIITLEIPDENSGESTELELYILATNYNEYALAYSCENVGTRRRVRAWQLSTDRTMSATGAATINEFIQNMRELHTPYFNQVPHNEDCLEPSSAILFKSSIIVIFICTVLQALW